MEHKTKIENIREALLRHKEKAGLAERVGCTVNNLHKIQSGYTRDPGSSLVDALCKELLLDPTTGLPLPPRIVRAKVPASLREKAKRERAGAGTQARGFNGNTAGGLDMEIPEELDLSEQEAIAILKARKAKHGSWIVSQAMILLRASDLREAQTEAIGAIVAGDYFRAIELVGRLGQNGSKR